MRPCPSRVKGEGSRWKGAGGSAGMSNQAVQPGTGRDGMGIGEAGVGVQVEGLDRRWRGLSGQETDRYVQVRETIRVTITKERTVANGGHQTRETVADGASDMVLYTHVNPISLLALTLPPSWSRQDVRSTTPAHAPRLARAMTDMDTYGNLPPRPFTTMNSQLSPPGQAQTCWVKSQTSSQNTSGCSSAAKCPPRS